MMRTHICFVPREQAISLPLPVITVLEGVEETGAAEDVDSVCDDEQ